MRLPKILFGLRCPSICVAQLTETAAKKRPIEQHDHKGKIEGTLIEAYRGTVSPPFAPGKHGRAAVRIVDDRGIESLKIREVNEN